jgi:hypothetical protein
MTNTSIYTVTLERADTWAFGAGLSEITFNCLAMPRKPVVENVVKFNGGGGKNTWNDEFALEIYPFSTVASTTDQDSSDLDLLIEFLNKDKPMRIKSSTLPRYDAGNSLEIPSRRAFVENCPVMVQSFEAGDVQKEDAETCSLVLQKVKL